MRRIDLQKFLMQAGDAKLINLEVSLGQMVQSDAFSSLVAYDEPWEWFCGNDLRLIIWPGPRFGNEILQAELIASLRDSLDLAGDLNQRMRGMGG